MVVVLLYVISADIPTSGPAGRDCDGATLKVLWPSDTEEVECGWVHFEYWFAACNFTESLLHQANIIVILDDNTEAIHPTILKESVHGHVPIFLRPGLHTVNLILVSTGSGSKQADSESRIVVAETFVQVAA